MASFIDLDNVALRYGGTEDGTLALEGTSIKVDKGEFVAVVGPSGCGKSTLMKVITGLWPPTEGTVIVDGQHVVGPLHSAGMAFQNPTLLPWRSTLDNVMLPLEVADGHRQRFRRDKKLYLAQARALLERVGLAKFEARFPWQLSGGMQQRASLCRALIHEPAVLMLDEPFGALDMFTREDLWAALQDLWLARRPTVVLVTHDLREAVFLADRVLVMSARPGRIIVERSVDIPRPRMLGHDFAAASLELVQELRDAIEVARREAAV